MTASLKFRVFFITALLVTALLGGQAAAAGLAAHTLAVDGRPRTYTVYVPSGYSPNQPLPVVIMLHGAGATGPGVIAETGWEKKAERENFLAVFPDAVRPDPAAPASFLANPQLWNDGSGRGLSFLSDIDDVRFLDRLVVDLAARYATDTKAVFLTGFSNGASLAFRAAALLPGRFAAIAPVAGPFWPDGLPPRIRPVPTLFIAGTADPLNPLDGGTITLPWGAFAQPPLLDRLREWAARGGCPHGLQPAAGKPGVTALTCRDGGVPLTVYLVEELGHIWPGGERLFPEAYVGKDPGALKATDEIWAFFAAVLTPKTQEAKP